MTVRCPHCGSQIPAEDYNVSTDLAVCRRCEATHKLSLLMRKAGDAPIYVEVPPGAWLEERDDGFRAGSTTRSMMALFLVPFALVWSGGAIWGIIVNPLLRGDLQGQNVLFAIPFAIGGVILWTQTLLAIIGRRELTVKGDEATLFVGIGPIGWRRRFRWSDIVSVEEVTVRNSRGGDGRAIALQGASSYTFGSDLTEARRYFLRETLRRKLRPLASGRPGAAEPYRAA